VYGYCFRTEKIEAIRTKKTKKIQEKDIIISGSGVQDKITVFIFYLVDSKQNKIKYKKFILSSIYVIVKLKYFLKKKTTFNLLLFDYNFNLSPYFKKITFFILINLKIQIKKKQIYQVQY